jgi:hypothetical protein
MGLKDILEANKVPLPSDFDERFNLVMMGLRKDPKFDEELRKFKEQTGGIKLPGITDKFNSVKKDIENRVASASDKIPATADTPMSLAPPMKLDSEDWMGPNIKWFLDAITSPYARVMLRSVFMVIFFVSYLEQLPAFGNIIGATLDLMVAGTRIITKSIQKNLPPIIGLLPLPYASLFGIVLAGMFGAIVWPLVAMVSFSRQEFAVSIESMFRAIPPPFGDTIADVFTDGNRMVAKLNMRRQKLASDLITAFGTIANVVSDVNNKINFKVGNVGSNIENLTSKIKQVAARPVGAKRLTNRRRVNTKWMKTRRAKYAKR